MTRWKILFALFAVLMAALPVKADEVQQSIFEENLKRAEAGDANSQFVVAHRYEIGVGTEKNVEKAFDWYRKAAKNGHPLAQFKLVARDEEAGKEARARLESEQARKTEQRSRDETEARSKALQTEAARKRKAAEAARLAAVEIKPVAVSQTKTEAVSETPVNAMDVVLGSLWQHNQTSAEILPSPNTSCLRNAVAEITCFTGESQQTVGTSRLSYTMKSILTRFAKDGSFHIQYVYNVTGLDKAETNAATAARSLSDIKPIMGWQEPGYTATCRVGSIRNIQCTTDRKAVLQFSKM